MLISGYKEIRGANYVPSYAKDDAEFWDKYDRVLIERELGYAKSMGLNSVRVLLNYQLYINDKKLILKRLDNFLSLCEKNNLTVMLILFNACFEFPNPEALVKNLIKDEKWRKFYQQWSEAIGMGKEIHKLFNLWTPTPGFKYLGKEFWQREEEYVKDIIMAHQGDSRIILYDVMNEPDSLFSFSEKREPYLVFLKHFCEYVKSLQGEIPITIGIASPTNISLVSDWEDILSFHTYEVEVEEFKRLITFFQEKSEEYQKPFIISEWGNSVYSSPKVITDEEQLRYYHTIMPLMKQANISWYFWELMVGNDPFAYQGIFYPNGQRRPAGSFIEEFLK